MTEINHSKEAGPVSVWSERLAVVFSFILIFAFNSIDNAIAPMVGPISQHFGVSEARALWLISFCSGGTVIGLFFGPSLLQAVPAKRCLAYVVGLLAGTQVLFALSASFPLANALRCLAGFSAGLVASVMWQLTFHGVSKAYFPAMIAVLMSARPLATAIGVPAAGLMAFNFSWQLPIWIIAALTAISGWLLYYFYPSVPARPSAAEQAAPAPADAEAAAESSGAKKENTGAAKEQSEKEYDEHAAGAASPQNEKCGLLMRILKPYGTALAAPYACAYYLGTTINRMAYFGFYSFCGIWFAEHYGLSLKDISFALLIIGVTEAAVNFTTNRIISWLGHKTTFLTSLGLSALILPLFIFGGLSLKGAVALIAVFMLLDRIYSMALVISVPKMFPIEGDMTAFGSLNTLTAWGAMCIIAWLQGLLGGYGISCLEGLILGCFFVGAAALIYVQKKTVF
ncbi:MAG: MFS transporter [bacterium]|nr:MFS transporter [bacterium]